MGIERKLYNCSKFKQPQRPCLSLGSSQNLFQKLSTKAFKIKAFLGQSHCVGCHDRLQSLQLLCPLCLERLPWIDKRCLTCSYPLNHDQPVCGACLTLGLSLDTTCLFRYEDPVRAMIHELKYRRHLGWGRFLGELLAACIKETSKPQGLIPVPSPRTRLRERGFNPAMELCLAMSDRTGIPIFAQTVACKPRRSQARLSRLQRLSNTRKSYYPVQSLGLTHVALVDDVVTTAATIKAVSEVLFQLGVLKVDVYAVARTVKQIN